MPPIGKLRGFVAQAPLQRRLARAPRCARRHRPLRAAMIEGSCSECLHRSAVRRLCTHRRPARPSAVRHRHEILQPLRFAAHRIARSRRRQRCRASSAPTAARSTTRIRRSSSAACRNGRAACCCASARSSRATDCGRCPPASSRTAKPSSRARCARRSRRRSARVELGELYTVISLPQINQVYMMFRARLLDLDFGPGAESLEVRLYRRSGHSVGVAGVPDHHPDAAQLFPRSQAGGVSRARELARTAAAATARSARARAERPPRRRPESRAARADAQMSLHCGHKDGGPGLRPVRRNLVAGRGRPAAL